MTPNYWMMEERYPNLKEEVGGLIPRCEISSLLDIILARWSIDSFALALACWAYVSRKKPKKKHQSWRHIGRFAHQILVKMLNPPNGIYISIEYDGRATYMETNP